MQFHPKLRDNRKRNQNEPYNLGDIPELVIREIAKRIVYNFAIGKNDLDGQDWGDIFAKAIGGEHLNSPLGLADVTLNGMAWSVKSIKSRSPHETKMVRIISGRCSPNYSYNIANPHENVAKTGAAVLNIWNERISVAKETYEPLRSVLLIRNPDTLDFTLFEHELSRFNTRDYVWKTNKSGNFEGINAETGKHVFTWQPHGSQFTIIYHIPQSTKKFRIKKPSVFDFEQTLSQIGFNDDWVTIL